MELRHLRYFVAVAEELHFGRAAKRLHVSQPPLSQQIRALEQELGVTLLVRTQRHVELTDAGQALLPEAKAAIARAERAVMVARRAGRGELGELHLGYSGSATFHPRVAKILGSFRAAYPEVRLIVSDLPTRAQERALIEGALDVGIVRPPLLHGRAEFHLTVIAEEPMCVALPSEHPLAKESQLRLSALADEAFVLYHRAANTSTFDRIIAACEKAGFAPHVAQEAPHFASVVGLVAAGLGVALVPTSVARVAAEGVVYRELKAPAPVIPLGVVWRQNNASVIVKSFREIVESVASG